MFGQDLSWRWVRPGSVWAMRILPGQVLAYVFATRMAEGCGVGNWFDRCRDRYFAWRFGAIDRSAPIGRRGEQAAAHFLRRKGLRILAESESDRAGEIDLIALDRRTLVFVEVKTLASHRPGHPAERVDEDKQRRITQAALRFLKRHGMLQQRARFDVVAIWWPDPTPLPERIEHYENAFEAVGNQQWFC